MHPRLAATRLLPGLLLVAALAAAARGSTLVLPEAVSEITTGVLLGVVFANVVKPGVRFEPGIRFSVQRLLRLGIVLLGARLSVEAVMATGSGAIVLILACFAFAFATAMLLGRALAVPAPLALLIAVGTAVCGNSAIVATAPLIRSEARHVSFAVATITLFGVAAVLVYPWIGMALDLGDPVFGHWVGVAVNDTSQVTAAGFAFSDPAGETATIVKLTRNLLIGPVLIAVALLTSRVDGERPRLGRRAVMQAVPLFVVGFVGMALLNSTGLLPAGLVAAADAASRALILLALVGVGLGTDLRALRQVGVRPLYVGLVTATCLAGIGLALSLALGA